MMSAALNMIENMIEGEGSAQTPVALVLTHSKRSAPSSASHDVLRAGATVPKLYESIEKMPPSVVRRRLLHPWISMARSRPKQLLIRN